jgi:hypothetical protein
MGKNSASNRPGTRPGESTRRGWEDPSGDRGTMSLRVEGRGRTTKKRTTGRAGGPDPGLNGLCLAIGDADSGPVNEKDNPLENRNRPQRKARNALAATSAGADLFEEFRFFLRRLVPHGLRRRPRANPPGTELYRGSIVVGPAALGKNAARGFPGGWPVSKQEGAYGTLTRFGSARQFA